LTNTSELHFYSRLFNLAASLTELYATPQSMDNAKELEGWLSQASDGLVLACISSLGEAPLENAEATIPNEVRIRPSTNQEVKRIADDLHIADAGLNSTYTSDAMCEFRGKLKAIMIKIILVRRVCPEMVERFVEQFERRVQELKQRTKTPQTAGLKPVHGALRSDSYYSVPDRVSHYCKASLIAASKNGVHLSLLEKASTKPKKASAKTSSSVASSPGPRNRRRSSKYLI